MPREAFREGRANERARSSGVEKRFVRSTFEHDGKVQSIIVFPCGRRECHPVFADAFFFFFIAFLASCTPYTGGPSIGTFTVASC